LAEAADGRSVNFEAKLQHNGQPSGFVRGKFRVWLDADGWDEEYVQNPSIHALNPKKLTKNFNASAHPQQRRKSPAPPGRFIMTEGGVDVKPPLPKLVVDETHEDHDMDDEDFLFHINLFDTEEPDDEDTSTEIDPLAELARENTIKNASTEVTGFRRFEPRVKKPKKLKKAPLPLATDSSKKEKKRGLIGGSTRRLSLAMGWGSQKD
jgi:hypothetical protein